MILPSDDNSTPEKRPKNRKSDTDPTSDEDEDDVPEPAAPPMWMPEELWKQLPSFLGEEPDMVTDSDAWREMLESELSSSIHELENFPDPECDFDPPDPPDLYTFHSELLALRQALIASQEKLLQKISTKKQPVLPQALVVQLGLLAGELRAAGNAEHSERLLKLIDSFS
jgi:hypothetical protein